MLNKWTKRFFKLGLLNIRSLTPKAVIVNEMITDNSFDVFWLKPGLKQMIILVFMNLLHQATVISMSLVRLVVAVVSPRYIVTCSMLLRKQDTGLTHSKYLLNVTLSDMLNKSVLSLALATVYRPPGPYNNFLKEFADFLSELLVNVDKALIVGDFNIHVDNKNDALGLYWPYKLFWCQAKCHRADTSF